MDSPSPRTRSAEADALTVLGVSAQELSTLRALVRAGHLSAGGVAEMLGISEPVAHWLLSRLAERGLAARRLEDSDTFSASRPSVALGAVLADRLAQLRMAEVTIGALDGEFAAHRHSSSAGDVLDIVLGAEAIAARLQQIQLGAREEVLSLVQAPVAVTGSEENTAEDVAVARGVAYRVVLERAMLEEEPRLFDEITRMEQLGEQIRVAATVPLKLLIIDREVALVPLAAPRGAVEGALLVHKSGLLDALVALFQAVWRDAFSMTGPVRDDEPGITVGASGSSGAPDPQRGQTKGRETDIQRLVARAQEPDEFDLQVLAMLMSGLTDKAVASALRVSVRTVQRRVRSIMTMARVDTRLQLGFAAHKRGWYTSPNPRRT